jgi:hypothetical protein
MVFGVSTLGQPQSTNICRVQSGVWRLPNIDPHPLSSQSVCPPPAPKAGGYSGDWGTLAGRTRGGEGVGGQYFGRRQTLDWPLTV